jgi:uncharacterized protein (TIGR03435 family)
MRNFSLLHIRFLPASLDRPVIDETGIKGEYHVGLDLSMQEMGRIARSAGLMGAGMGPAGPGAMGTVDAASDPGGGATLFNAVQHLGLRLNPKKEPVETIVVDHVGKAPIEN